MASLGERFYRAFLAANEVRERVDVLGAGGGYVLCSSHHIQPDTRVENVLAMYDPELRVRR